MTENEKTIEAFRALAGNARRGEIVYQKQNWIQRIDWFEAGVLVFVGTLGVGAILFLIGCLLLFAKLVLWVWSL